MITVEGGIEYLALDQTFDFSTKWCSEKKKITGKIKIDEGNM